MPPAMASFQTVAIRSITERGASGPPIPGAETGVLYSGTIDGVIIVLTILALIIVCMRVYIRSLVIKHFSWDDGLIVFAMLASITTSILNVLQAEWGNDHGLIFSSKRALQAGYGTNITYILGIVAIKTSIMVFCLGVFGGMNKKVKYGLIGVIVFLQLHMIAGICAVLFGCKNIASYWTPGSLMDGCFDIGLNATTQSSISVIEDFVVLVVPLYLVSTVKAEKGRKRFLLGILALGFFAFASGLVRCIILITFAKHIQDPLTWVVLPIVTAIEVNVAIIAASLPSLSPLLKNFARNVRNTIAMTSSSNNNASGLRHNTFSKSGAGGVGGSPSSALHKGALSTADAHAHGNHTSTTKLTHKKQGSIKSNASTADLPLRAIKVDQAYTVEHTHLNDADSDEEVTRSSSGAEETKKPVVTWGLNRAGATSPGAGV